MVPIPREEDRPQDKFPDNSRTCPDRSDCLRNDQSGCFPIKHVNHGRKQSAREVEKELHLRSEGKLARLATSAVHELHCSSS